MKKCFIYLTLLLLAVFTALPASAQAPVATPQEAIAGLLNRIGGNGAADKFEIVIDASLAENGKDVFVITSQNGTAPHSTYKINKKINRSRAIHPKKSTLDRQEPVCLRLAWQQC